MNVVVNVPETVLDDCINQLTVSKSVSSESAFVKIERCIRHAFKSSSNNNILQSINIKFQNLIYIVSKHYTLSTIHNSLHSRSAYFVDGCANDIFRESSTYSSLTSRCLSNVGTENVSKDDFFDLFWIDLGFFECSFDYDGTEFRA